MPGSQVQGDRAVPRGTLPSSAPGKAGHPNRVYSEVLGGAEELREAGAQCWGLLGGARFRRPRGMGGPWDPHLLALLLTVSQEQLQAPEVESEQLLFGDGEEEALEIQAPDDVVPDGAALPVVAAEATGLVQPDHLDGCTRERGWAVGAGLMESRGLGRAGRWGLTSEGCHMRMLSRSCCFLNFIC